MFFFFLSDNANGENFNQRLKSARKNAGYTGKEFAEKLGISYNTYITYENGSREPKQETLIKIADLLQVSIDSLLGVIVPSKQDSDLDIKPLLVKIRGALSERGANYDGQILPATAKDELIARIDEFDNRAFALGQ